MFYPGYGRAAPQGREETDPVRTYRVYSPVGLYGRLITGSSLGVSHSPSSTRQESPRGCVIESPGGVFDSGSTWDKVPDNIVGKMIRTPKCLGFKSGSCAPLRTETGRHRLLGRPL